MAVVKLNHVNKRWGDFIAVDDFNLEIADKEFLVLLGPSGCGKTTTMRMIAGLESITDGEIFIGDRRVNDVEPKDRDVAMVFQSYGLYPNMTVYENIRFPLKIRSVPAAEHDERVMRAADLVELGDFLHRRPAELSGGQRQRVALARAIVRQPTVFLMDEPLSNLDAKLRVSTRIQIKELQRELEITTVYVTHDQVEAMTMADRVVVMNNGVIQQIGTPRDIYETPQNTFVAGFMGTPAMNMVRGEFAHGRFFAEDFEVTGFDAARHNGYSGAAVLGFRAEDASIDEAASVRAKVLSTELLGDSAMVTFRLAGVLMTVKADKRCNLDRGEAINVSIPATICHVFAGDESGELLFRGR